MPSGTNHYARLGVSRDATPEEIRSAYFEAARRLHPDTNPDPDAQELFIQIQDAYEILSNPEKRAQYEAVLPPPDLSPPNISQTIQYSRSCLPRVTEAQLIYVLLELTSIPDPTVNVSPPLNLCLVLDCSTSMQGPRMDMVKSNAIQLLRQMKPQDTISIVTFSDRAEVLIPATRVSDLNRIEARINQLQTGGGTEIYHGLETGLTQIHRNLSPSTINHLILLTDGRTYGDEDACLLLAEQAAIQGIGISGLGIGHEWNDAFLDKLTSSSGGSSTYISAPKELHKFLEQKYSSLGRVYAEQVTLDFECDDNVELKCVFRLQPEATPLTITSPIRVGNIQQFNSLTLLLEFKVHNITDRMKEINLAHGRIRMEIPTRTIPTTRIRLSLSRPVVWDAEPEPPPHTIIQALSRLTLYRLQEKAREEVGAGNIAKATRHLHYLATHLLSQGERELAHTVLIEADHIQQNQHFSKEGDKRIKYGTRALMLPPGLESKRP
jgi:Ca-activated chloride channel family protein